MMYLSFIQVHMWLYFFLGFVELFGSIGLQSLSSWTISAIIYFSHISNVFISLFYLLTMSPQITHICGHVGLSKNSLMLFIFSLSFLSLSFNLDSFSCYVFKFTNLFSAVSNLIWISAIELMWRYCTSYH